MNQVVRADSRAGVIASTAKRYGMLPEAFEATLRATVVPKECTKEQFAAFLLVAREYNLNPITKEIYAFPSRNGIQPIVSIDGWMKLMNSHPQFDGIEFEDHADERGDIAAITAKVYRKDRSHPVSVTEYMAECQRQTEPWQKWPRRMLRHKAAIQAARYAFGFSGIIDPDEYERFSQIPSQYDYGPVSPPPVVQDQPVEQQQPAREAEEIRNPDDVINEIENIVSGIESEEELDQVWSEYKKDPALEFPGDKARAQSIISKARERITA